MARRPPSRYEDIGPEWYGYPLLTEPERTTDLKQDISSLQPEQWVSIITPLIGAMLAGGAMVANRRGKDEAAAIMMLGWSLVSGLSAAAGVVAKLEEDRQEARERAVEALQAEASEA